MFNKGWSRGRSKMTRCYGSLEVLDEWTLDSRSLWRLRKTVYLAKYEVVIGQGWFDVRQGSKP